RRRRRESRRHARVVPRRAADRAELSVLRDLSRHLEAPHGAALGAIGRRADVPRRRGADAAGLRVLAAARAVDADPAERVAHAGRRHPRSDRRGVSAAGLGAAPCREFGRRGLHVRPARPRRDPRRDVPRRAHSPDRGRRGGDDFRRGVAGGRKNRARARPAIRRRVASMKRGLWVLTVCVFLFVTARMQAGTGGFSAGARYERERISEWKLDTAVIEAEYAWGDVFAPYVRVGAGRADVESGDSFQGEGKVFTAGAGLQFRRELSPWTAFA